LVQKQSIFGLTTNITFCCYPGAKVILLKSLSSLTGLV
jgi:hypothetical protein